MPVDSSKNESLPRLCVLVSGGLDSAVLLQEALDRGWEVYPLFVSAGFVWEQAELHWLRRLLESLADPRLKSLAVFQCPLREFFPSHWAFTSHGVPDAASEDSAVYLPARNLQLLTQAAVYAQSREISEIWIGVLSANPFGDGQREFFDSFERTCRLGLPRPLRIEAPFRELSKAKVVHRHPNFPYELTFSCIRPNGIAPCGACNKCEERRKAFLALGIQEKTE